MKTRRILGLGVVAAALAVACGGKTEGEASGNGGSGGATGGSGGAKDGGNTGGSSGGATGGSGATGGIGGGLGGIGATGGAGGIEMCDDLLKGYSDTIWEAKKCIPMINKLQCTVSFLDSPTCGCPTYVNEDQTDALYKLQSQLVTWSSLGCDQWINCGGVMCPEPQGAGCVPDDPAGVGPVGHCQDYWPD